MLSPKLDGCFAIAISLEFSLTPFLSIKEATLFDNCQPDFQPYVVRRYLLPVRPRYAAVIAGLGDQRPALMNFTTSSLDTVFV